MPSPPSTRPSDARGRRSFAFAREDSGRIEVSSRDLPYRQGIYCRSANSGFGPERRVATALRFGRKRSIAEMERFSACNDLLRMTQRIRTRSMYGSMYLSHPSSCDIRKTLYDIYSILGTSTMRLLG